MGDEDDRHALFILQIAHQVENLGLGGDIQRGGRLVGDENGVGKRAPWRSSARWRMPPLSWNGDASMRRSGCGMLTAFQHIDA